MNKKTFRKLLPWFPLAVYWPLLFFSTHIPRIPNLSIPASDKVMHFLAYGVLTLLFWFAKYGLGAKPNFKKPPIYKTILLFAVYGLLDEVTQNFVGRVCSLDDWISDMAGTLTALFCVLVFRRRIYWLLAYWAALFLATHWPHRPTPFERLPDSIQQFQIAFLFTAYLILTLLWNYTLSKKTPFTFSWTYFFSSLLVLTAYALLDDLVNPLFFSRALDTTDLLSALAGILVGFAVSYALARHHALNTPAEPVDTYPPSSL